MGNDVSRVTDSSDEKSKKIGVNERRTARQMQRPLFMPAIAPGSSGSTRSTKKNVLNQGTGNIRELYCLGKELGRGQFGVTRVCSLKSTGETFACKSIAKRKLETRQDVEDVRTEVRVLRHLSGRSQHIIEFKGAFEDQHHVHLVMQFCSGGELFHRIASRGKYSEQAAAVAFRGIAQVIGTCHSNGVMHRDLKPENFVLLNKDANAPLMVIDFGLSTFFKPGDTFKALVGSAYYIAPEVLEGNYGSEADIWSAGVVLYIMLSGFPPFSAKSEEDIFKSIRKDPLDLTSPPWPSISDSAKDLLQRMLNKNPKKRITIEEMLHHPWLHEAPDTLIDNAVVTRLKQFRAMNKLKRLALKFIVEDLSEEEVSDVMEWFQSMDVDGSGTLTVEELRRGLAKQGCLLSESEVQDLLDAADTDGNGTIDYQEFMTATVQMDKMQNKDRLLLAFRRFDSDNSGYITTEELEGALQGHNIYMGDDEQIEDIIAEVDSDKDGRVNYEEFVALMQ